METDFNYRKNVVLLIIHAPEEQYTFEELKQVFSSERAVHINKDLYINSYQTAKSHINSIRIIAYSRTTKHPDLTWLSVDDPGFLECNKKSYSSMLSMAMSLAFNTGCERLVYINHLCPYINKEHIDFAFSNISEKNAVIGASNKGEIYMFGTSRENMKLFDNFSPFKENLLSEIIEQAKKNKINITGMEELNLIKDEDSLKKWLENKTMRSAIFTGFANKSAALPLENVPSNHKKKKKHVENAIETNTDNNQQNQAQQS